jgi:Protein of unknown function (DUF2877)
MVARRVAASTRIRPLIDGPIRAGLVLGVFPSAVYVDVGAELVAVETADGLRLPCAATLAAHSRTRPLQDVRAGDVAQVGQGRIDVGPLGLDVVRWWSPRRPRAVSNQAYDAARLTAVAQLLPPLPPELADRLCALTCALLTSRAKQLQHAVTALLGLGQGLTPQGDDVLAGVLVTLAASPATQPMAHQLGGIVDSQADRTTTLSAALLRDAADGFAVPPLVDLVDALHFNELHFDELHEVDHAGRTTTHRALADVVVRLLAVGHTSGAALAHGALAAARLPATTCVREGVA